MPRMSEPAPILYLGDTRLEAAASYLAGVLHHAGLTFDYVPSDASALDRLNAGPRRLIILSDYLASSLEPEGHDRIVERHHEGAGLLMLGGWESYHGLGGDWDDKPAADVLPEGFRMVFVARHDADGALWWARPAGIVTPPALAELGVVAVPSAVLDARGDALLTASFADLTTPDGPVDSRVPPAATRATVDCVTSTVRSTKPRVMLDSTSVSV